MMGKAVHSCVLSVFVLVMLLPGLSFISAISSDAALEPATLTVGFDFAQPVVSDSSLGQSIEVEGLERCVVPGQPVVPFKPVKLLIPQGYEVVRVEALPGEEMQLVGEYRDVEKAQRPMVWGDPRNAPEIPLDETVHDVYPGKYLDEAGTHWLRGYSFISLNLFPVQYREAVGEVSWVSTMTVRVELVRTGYVSPLFRGLASDRADVMRRVENPGEADTYAASASPPGTLLPSGQYTYVIITDVTLEDEFNVLRDYKQDSGVTARTHLLQDIYADYDGQDQQERIRNFIIDAYATWGTKYVLLGGDTYGQTGEVYLPHRGFSVMGDDDVPSDLYYACLDGDWNADGDGLWGELEDEPDYYAEVYVGRAPVCTPFEVQTFVGKVIHFDQNRLYDIMLHGAWVDTYTDCIDIKEGTEEIDGCHDYITPEYSVHTLYESEIGEITPEMWDADFEAGRFIQNHANHGDTEMYALDGYNAYYESDAEALTNTYYPVQLSICCYSGAFDGRTSYGGYVSDYDCLAESFLLNPNGGTSAMVFNSRYGYYGGSGDPITYAGELDIKFYELLFQDGIYNLGETVQGVREWFSSYADYNDVYRCSIYEWNLLGDPEMTMIYLDPDWPDLTLDESDVTFDPAEPNQGETVTIDATVHNVGTVDTALGVQLGFYLRFDDGSEVQIGEIQTAQPYNIPPGGSGTASVVLDTTGLAGFNNVLVKADPSNTIQENNENNNVAISQLTVQGYGVTLDCDDAEKKGAKGNVVEYNVTLTNSGTYQDSYALDFISHDGWEAYLSQYSVNDVPPQGSAMVVLSVVIPASATPGEIGSVTVNVGSVSDPATNAAVLTQTTAAARIAVVDDNGQEEDFCQALEYAGLAYELLTPGDDISAYNIVVWVIGGSYNTLTIQEQDKLADYLDAGGNLFVSGEDIGYDIGWTDFYHDYLGADYVSDSSFAEHVNGITFDPISDGFSWLPIAGYWPSIIAPVDADGSAVFTYADGSPGSTGAIKVERWNYRLVYFAFKYFEGTDGIEQKAVLMERIIDWLEQNQPPEVEVHTPSEPGMVLSNEILINWTATDEDVLPPGCVNIYCDFGEGVWEPIATGLDNTGSYLWEAYGWPEASACQFMVTVTDAGGLVGLDLSYLFSLDSIPDNGWYLHRDDAAITGCLEMSMKPVSVTAEAEYTNLTNNTGQFLQGKPWVTAPVTLPDSLKGIWEFTVWGRATDPVVNGTMFAKVFRYRGGEKLLLFETAQDDEYIGNYRKAHAFNWNHTLDAVPDVDVGDRLEVEFWIQSTSGNSGVYVDRYSVAEFTRAGYLEGNQTMTHDSDDVKEVLHEYGSADPEIFYDDFGMLPFTPPGWELADYRSTPWQPTTSRLECLIAGLGDAAMICDPSNGGLGDTAYSWLRSPYMDCSSFTTVMLNLTSYFSQGWTDAEGWIYVTNDGYVDEYDDIVWQSIGGMNDYSELSIDISAIAAKEEFVQIGFLFTGQWLLFPPSYWAVDDIVVYGTDQISWAEHFWLLPIPGNSTDKKVVMEASRDDNGEGDDFSIQYSVGNDNWTEMFTISSQYDTAYEFYLPWTVEGYVFVRAVDTDRTVGHKSSTALYVDVLRVTAHAYPPRFEMFYDGAHKADSRVEIVPPPTSCTIPLEDGWNLISAPMVAALDIPSIVTNTLGGTVVALEWYDSGTDQWGTYSFDKPGEVCDFGFVEQRSGFWLLFNDEAAPGGSLTIEGRVFTYEWERTITLHPGWNMVGYPTTSNKTMAESFGDLWNDRLVVVSDESGAILSGSDTMHMGDGYWVYLFGNEPADWVCPV